MDQQITAQLQMFLKEIDSRTVGTISVDGLVDSVLKHSTLLQEICFAKKDSASFDTSNLTMVFTEIVRQIYSSFSSSSFNEILSETSLPWVGIADSVSSVLSVTSNTVGYHTNYVKKRLRYRRHSSKADMRKSIPNKSDFEPAVDTIISALRKQLHVFTSPSFYGSNNQDSGWRSLCAVGSLFELLIACALDGVESRSVQGFASLSSLFSFAVELTESILSSPNNEQSHLTVYPLLLVVAICILSMLFHETSDLRLPMLRWISILDAFLKSPLSKNLQLLFDYFLLTVTFLTFIYLSCSWTASSQHVTYGLQNVANMLLLLRSFIGSKTGSSSLSLDACALLLRFVSFFIRAVRLYRVKSNYPGSAFRSTGPYHAKAAALAASGGHCCSFPEDVSCSIQGAMELAMDIVRAGKIASPVKDSSSGSIATVELTSVDLLLAELVRSGCCCCCFERGSDMVAPLLKAASRGQRHQSSLLAVNFCIRVFLDYHPRPEIPVQGQHSSCPFHFLKDSNRNDLLAEYISIPLSIFTSNVNLNKTVPLSGETNTAGNSEESCFQIARQILTLTSTAAFSTSSQARHFLFRHLAGPLFDWVLAACFDQTDLFISRRAVPLVLRILEDFLGDKDLSYFADFASTSRLSCMSRIFEAGNGFCYIINLIRILVRCPSHGGLLLSPEAVSQLEVVKKVAVSTFLSAFYSASKRLTTALLSTNEETALLISCHDLQIMSHCFFMLDESPYFLGTFVNQQSTEGFITLLSAFENYITRCRPDSFSNEFIQIFVYVMGSMFRLKSLPVSKTVASFANVHFFSAHHEFYSLLRISFDSFCALLTYRPPSIDHWCIIRDYHGGGSSAGIRVGARKSTTGGTEEDPFDETATYTTSVGELQQLIGGTDITADETTIIDSDSEDYNEDEYKQYTVVNESEEEDDDAGYGDNPFGNGTTNSSSFASFVGPRFYLALELVKILCRFIRHCRNCIDQSCPAKLAELTCSLESILAMATQARADSFSNKSIENVFDLIFSGDLHPFLLNTEHNWHTIQHLLFCLLANLGSRHVTPRHLCAIFRMTTGESVSLVSAATSCLTKLAALSDFRAPPFCLRVGSSNSYTGGEKLMQTTLPIRWQPGKCCLTFCTWILLEQPVVNIPDGDAQSVEVGESPTIPLCSFGCNEFFIVVTIARHSKDFYDAYAEITLNGKLIRRKLHLPFNCHRWHMLALQIRDEMIGNKEQYSACVTAVLDCEYVSTASAVWPVEDVPRKEVENKKVPHFSPPVLVIGGCDSHTANKINSTDFSAPKKSKSPVKVKPSAPVDSILLAGAIMFSSWLESEELLQVFARLPAWLSQPLTSLTTWPAYPAMCVTPKIIDDNPRAFTQVFKQAPDFFSSICLILRPKLNREEASQVAEFVRVTVQESKSPSQSDQNESQTTSDQRLFSEKLIASVASSSEALLSLIECANFHNSVLQVGGPDFLIAWLSSLGSITDLTTCQFLLLAGVETLLTSIRHPHIYARFVEMQGFEMLYQLLMLKIVPHGNTFLDEGLVKILVNASLNRPILTTSTENAEAVFTASGSFSAENFTNVRVELNRFDAAFKDAGVLVQVPEIWSQILLKANFLNTSSHLSCWRLIFGTVSLLVSSSAANQLQQDEDGENQQQLSSDLTATVSSTSTFNRAVFLRMEFPCRCYAVLRSLTSAPSANEQAISEIVLSSLGDFVLSMNDPSAVDTIIDFLVALYPLSAFVVDIAPTDLFPAFLFSSELRKRLYSITSRSSRGGSFSFGASFEHSYNALSEDQRPQRQTSSILSPSLDASKEQSTQQPTPNNPHSLPKMMDEKRRKSSLSRSVELPTIVDPEVAIAQNSTSTSSDPGMKRGVGVMVHLVEVLDLILRKYPHTAYTRLFKYSGPETYLFFLGGETDDVVPSVDFSCRLLHTLWQSLSAAECRFGLDLFLRERGPVLISFQLSRALGIDTTPKASPYSPTDGLNNSLFSSLSAYYYDILCRNVCSEQANEWNSNVAKNFRAFGCKCSSLTAAVKSGCPAKTVLAYWWSIPAVELGVCSLFSFRNSPESRALLRMVAMEFFIIGAHICPPTSLNSNNNSDVDGIARIWALVSAKVQMIWLLIVATMSAVQNGNVNEDIANKAQRHNFEHDVDLSLTCTLAFLLTVFSSNSFSSSTSETQSGEAGRAAIDSQPLFWSLVATMSSVFPEIGIDNYFLTGALRQLERIWETNTSDFPRSLPVRKLAASGPGPSSQSVPTPVSFMGFDDYDSSSSSSSSSLDDSDEDSQDPNNITFVFEQSMTYMLKTGYVIPRFVELLASHLRRWPDSAGSGDLAKALLLFVVRQVEACGGSHGIAADAGCLMATCAAAVTTKAVDVLIICEILHRWMTGDTTALCLPFKQWRSAQAGSVVAYELRAYDVEKGPFLLPTQRARLKEVINKLPPIGRPTIIANSSSMPIITPDGNVMLKVKRCCDSLLPITDRITDMNRSAREQHHSKRKALTLRATYEPTMNVRLELIKIVRRFAHPAAPMGDSSMVSTLYPDEWELDQVEGTLGVYIKLRRQALSLPSDKVYRLQESLQKSQNGSNNSLDAAALPGGSGSSSDPNSAQNGSIKVVAHSTFLICDCSDNAENPIKIVRDWTYLVRTFGVQLASGFLSALVELFSPRKSGSLESEPRIDLSCQCTLVTPSTYVDGEMFVTQDRVLFLSQTATVEDIYRQCLFDLHSGVPVLVTFRLNSVMAVYPRRYLLKENALEVFLSSGKAYFFAFNPESVEIVDGAGQRRKVNYAGKPLPLSLAHEVCERVRSVLLAKCRIGTGALPSPTDLQVKWLKGQLTNFEYLTLLNRAGGRSTNELMQYPVFPWVLADYTSPTIDLSSPSSYRDLSKQIPLQPYAQGEERVLMRYAQLQGEGAQPYHFPSLYSNSGITAHYLVRIPPFTQACLSYQDGNFDIPDRTFLSLAATWSIADIKELLPEFFFLSEFLVNFYHLNLGICQNGVRVWDVVLPPWAGNNPRRFILVHRQALESAYVRACLPKWIDLIFGFRQNGKAAVDAYNVFHPSTYFSSAMNVDLQTLLVDPVLFAARQAQIRTYGQVPRQLFEFAHPTVGKITGKKGQRSSGESSGQVSDDSFSEPKSDMFGDDMSLLGISVGNYAGSHSKLVCVWQADFPIDVSRESAVDVVFTDPSSLTVLVGPSYRQRSLLTIIAPQKQRRRNLLTSSAPISTVTGVLNCFNVDIDCCLSGGFAISTTKRVPAWSSGTGNDYALTDKIVNQFHAIANHEVTCGPVHSTNHSVIFFGTSVGLILVYKYEIDEIDLSSEHPADRLPVFNKMPVQVLCAHETAAAVTALAISDDFKFFVAGTADGRVVFFDLNWLSFVRQISFNANNSNTTAATTAVKHLTISRTLGDVAVYWENGQLAIFTVNGVLVGQTTGPKNVATLEFSSCPEGTSVNSLLLVSTDPSLLTFYCAWDLRLVRKICLDEIRLTEQAIAVSQSSAARRGKAATANKRTKRTSIIAELQTPVKTCYSHPDSQLIAVLSRNSLALYSNASPSAQAAAAIKNLKVTLIS